MTLWLLTTLFLCWCMALAATVCQAVRGLREAFSKRQRRKESR